jgi:hypothetical protein
MANKTVMVTATINECRGAIRAPAYTKQYGPAILFMNWQYTFTLDAGSHENETAWASDVAMATTI